MGPWAHGGGHGAPWGGHGGPGVILFHVLCGGIHVNLYHCLGFIELHESINCFESHFKFLKCVQLLVSSLPTKKEIGYCFDQTEPIQRTPSRRRAVADFPYTSAWQRHLAL